MNKVFQYKTPKESTGFLVWKMSNYWQREIKKSLAPLNLTHTQFVVLANTYYLNTQQNNVTQVNIAKQVGIDKMLTSNVLKALLKKKFINRAEHQTDTRAKVINLTQSGQDIFNKAIIAVEDFDKSFFSKLKDSNSFNTELLTLLDDEF